MSKRVRVAGAVLAFALALVAAYIAGLSKTLICEGDAGTSCRTTLMTVQLVVALAGLVPAGGLVAAVVSDHRKAAVASLATGLVAYAVWGVLNNVAVHGW